MGLFEDIRKKQLDEFLENGSLGDNVIFNFGSHKELTGEVISKDPGTSMPLQVRCERVGDGLWINEEDIDLIEDFSVGDKVIFNQNSQASVVKDAFYGIVTKTEGCNNEAVFVDIYNEDKVKIKDSTYISICYFSEKRLIKFNWEEKKVIFKSKNECKASWIGPIRVGDKIELSQAAYNYWSVLEPNPRVYHKHTVTRIEDKDIFVKSDCGKFQGKYSKSQSDFYEYVFLLGRPEEVKIEDPISEPHFDVRKASDFPGTYRFTKEAIKEEHLYRETFEIVKFDKNSTSALIVKIRYSDGITRNWGISKNEKYLKNFDLFLTKVEVIEKVVEKEKIVEKKIEVLPLGTPVVRGPDWEGPPTDKIGEYQTQGKIVYIYSTEGWYDVMWENGNRSMHVYSDSSKTIVPGIAKSYEEYLKESESKKEENKESQSFGLFKTIDL